MSIVGITPRRVLSPPTYTSPPIILVLAFVARNRPECSRHAYAYSSARFHRLRSLALARALLLNTSRFRAANAFMRVSECRGNSESANTSLKSHRVPLSPSCRRSPFPASLSSFPFSVFTLLRFSLFLSLSLSLCLSLSRTNNDERLRCVSQAVARARKFFNLADRSALPGN